MPAHGTPADEPVEVVILCGGKGTRAYPDTLEVPKPLLLVGDLPIVEHVMRIYARQGHRRFILAAGYLGEMIAERYAEPPDGFDVEVVDTGTETETGERLRRAAAHVLGERFFATYADGVADIDVNALLAEHLESGALATLTTVPLPSQYGVLESDGQGRIHRFREKPRLREHWINGGFFVFENAALDHWTGEVLERDVLPALAELGELGAYRHQGFWQSMDTYKDRQSLDSLARGATPPWMPATVSVPVVDYPAPVRVGSAKAASGSRSALALAGRGPAVTPPAPAQRETPNAAAQGGAPTPTGRRATAAMLAGVDAGVAPSREEAGSGPSDGRHGDGPSDGRHGNGHTDGRHGNGHTDEGHGNGHTDGPHGNGGDATNASLPTTTTKTETEAEFLPPPRRQARRRLAVLTGLTALLDCAAIVLAYRLVGSIESGPLAERLLGSGRAELLATVPIWLAVMAMYGLYDRRRIVAASEEARRLLNAIAIGAVGTILVTFAWNQDVGRSWVAVTALVIFALVGLSRLVTRMVVQLLATRGSIGTRVLVVGTNDEAHAIARTLDRKRWLGYCPVGLIDTGRHATDDGFPVQGHIDDIAETIRRCDAGAVVIASTAVETDTLNDLCDLLQHLHVDVRVSAGLPQVAAARVAVAPLDGLAVLSVRPSHQLSATQKLAKRTVDLVAATIGLLLAGPVILVLAGLVRLSSGGHAVFRQLRIGAGGKPFVLYKLRTMVSDAEDRVIDLRGQNEADGLLFKVEDDPRVTHLGRRLRRWGLDELPQLWNVVKGEMSLVGPRPPLPSEARRYDEWVRGRLEVKPGITGLWQVNGGHELRFDDYVRYDLFYVENWSVGLDLYILFRTLPALVFRRGLS